MSTNDLVYTLDVWYFEITYLKILVGNFASLQVLNIKFFPITFFQIYLKCVG